MTENPIYRIVFHNDDQIYELYARHVFQSDIYGFVAVEDFIFGENSTLLVDPSEEKLKSEFEGVKRSFLPHHEIIRIDQVERRGTAKILPINAHAGQGSNKKT